MFTPTGIDAELIYDINEDGDIFFERQSIDRLVEYAQRNPRKAISNRTTGRYAVAAPKGFVSD